MSDVTVVRYGVQRPPYAAYILTHHLGVDEHFNFVPDETLLLAEIPEYGIRGNIAVAEWVVTRAASLAPGSIVPADFLEGARLRYLVEFSSVLLSSWDLPTFDRAIQRLEYELTGRTFLVSNDITLADLIAFEALRTNGRFHMFRSKLSGRGGGKKKRGAAAPTTAAPQAVLTNCIRFYTYLDSVPTISVAVKLLAKSARSMETTANLWSFQRTSRVFTSVLPDATMGEVCTRFPPEASGYIHIGHAKAALINYYFSLKYNGKMVFRFDDTNPEREKLDFEVGILEDMDRLGIPVDRTKVTYTSNHFDFICECATRLIQEGKAYVDDTPKEEFKEMKWNGIEPPTRGRSVEDNLELWAEMQAGTERGVLCCLRAKMDMTDPNKCCRDPVMYRCKLGFTHCHTGDRWKVYPTYDFACPIVDSLEEVTHALRTSEYNDRNKQYYTFLDMLGMRKPLIADYSRANFFYTVMSKRKLRKLIASNFLEGWDDPRLPTVRALLRRGITSEAITDFMLSQAASRRVSNYDWEVLYAANKKKIDPIVPRFAGFEEEGHVRVQIEGLENTPRVMSVRVHPQNPKMGRRDILITSEMLLRKEDLKFISAGEEVTLRHIGNVE